MAWQIVDSSTGEALADGLLYAETFKPIMEQLKAGRNVNRHWVEEPEPTAPAPHPCCAACAQDKYAGDEYH